MLAQVQQDDRTIFACFFFSLPSLVCPIVQYLWLAVSRSRRGEKGRGISSRTLYTQVPASTVQATLTSQRQSSFIMRLSRCC